MPFGNPGNFQEMDGILQAVGEQLWCIIFHGFEDKFRRIDRYIKPVPGRIIFQEDIGGSTFKYGSQRHPGIHENRAFRAGKINPADIAYIFIIRPDDDFLLPAWENKTDEKERGYK